MSADGALQVRALQRRRLSRRLGELLLGIVLLTALVGVFYTPYDPLVLEYTTRLAPPSAEHILGTDQFGRDVLSRTMAAAGTSVTVSFFTVFVAVLLGVLLGSLSGYVGGWLDRFVVLVLDAFMAFPGILLALAIMAAIGPHKFGIILALGLAYMPNVARIVRSTVFSVREKEFVEASVALGNSEWYTITRHVIPQCISPLTVIATAIFGGAILSESALSFLGLGVPPPHPTWGGMLADARQYMSIAPWLSIFPGVAITIALLGVNLFGDALRDRFDPRVGR
jgi:peptide/nickel transport system permease protein